MLLRVDRDRGDVELLDFDHAKHTGPLPPKVGEISVRDASAVFTIRIEDAELDKYRRH